MERREFLIAAGVLPAFGATLSQRAGRTLRHSAFDPWVEVHAGHLRANAGAIHGHTRVPILAVIKNNGYGAGVVNVARALDAVEHVHGFAVVKLHEAMLLRDAAIAKPVLLMGPADERDLTDAAARGIEPMLYTPVQRAIERIAARRDRPVRFHVCVDTGLGRVGVPHQRAFDLVQDLGRTRGAHISGLMMTFTEDEAFDRVQLDRFTSLGAQLDRARISTGLKHAASSYALFAGRERFLDMVRPGMAIYGIYPEPQFRATGVLDLRPALSLKTRVIYVKQLQAGDSAGYNRAYVADRPVWIATLPVGHADGLPRVAAKGGRVRIGGTLYPIIASVSASHTIVEIGAEPRVAIGDEATLFDWTEGSRPEDFAASCGASVYDLTMHLNPLLPRRIVGA